MSKQSNRDRRGKRGGKRDGKRRDPGTVAIAKAEKKLARALADLDDARATVSQRERQMSELLVTFDRMPTLTPDSVPLFDQTLQITDVNQEAVRAMLDQVDPAVERDAGAVDGES